MKYLPVDRDPKDQLALSEQFYEVLQAKITWYFTGISSAITVVRVLIQRTDLQ